MGQTAVRVSSRNQHDAGISGWMMGAADDKPRHGYAKVRKIPGLLASTVGQRGALEDAGPARTGTVRRR